jgi:hypothetical protein
VRRLRAARHARRYPATESERGRPGRRGRERLSRVAALLDHILQRETPQPDPFTPKKFVDNL